jgi:hypothetical protein
MNRFDSQIFIDFLIELLQIKLNSWQSQTLGIDFNDTIINLVKLKHKIIHYLLKLCFGNCCLIYYLIDVPSDIASHEGETLCLLFYLHNGILKHPD